MNKFSENLKIFKRHAVGLTATGIDFLKHRPRHQEKNNTRFF